MVNPEDETMYETADQVPCNRDGTQDAIELWEAQSSVSRPLEEVMSSPFRGRTWQAKLRRRAYDPVLCEVPHDVWALPAHVAQMGPFTIAEVRSFPETPSFKRYLDVVCVSDAQRVTLILPHTTWNEDTLAWWDRCGRLPWRFTLDRSADILPRWQLQRLDAPEMPS